MSEVEQYWKAIAKKFGDNREFTDLHPNEQMMIIQSINMLLQVLHNGRG